MDKTIIDFLKSHISEQTTLTDWLSVIIYAFTLAVASWAAWTAKRALAENQKITRVHTDPFIIVKLDHMVESINWFRLKIANESLGHAFKIKIEIKNKNSRKYSLLADKILSRINTPNFMIRGVNHLSPSEQKFSNFFTMDKVIEQDQRNTDMFFNLNFEVTVTYQNKNKKNFCDVYILDFSEFKDVERITSKSVYDRHLDEFKKINKNLSDLKSEQIKFKNEYEKANRGWTETELREKVSYFDKQRVIRKALNQVQPDDLVDRRVLPRESIQKIRRKNK
ncbi:hypothetical protein GFH30_00550 [Acinetobacter wanghuae]|uniref:Uncharacterized protein n=1 Tax=Acinetobacter wanghuae TaxID=2662362 RepID=A0A5Q0NYT2_9GAMM|nr:hypothetical protein [Acinetobacter wanghuae]MQW91876.1 hypothetical protein [Acinetobacter wanghuae]QGA09979.1 hypothetical protein GFH30_00550 [Acinetobacter wanghuae]